MENDTFYLTRERMLKLGIDPEEVISYIENKKAITVNPAHVKALQVLKDKPVVQTS